MLKVFPAYPVLDKLCLMLPCHHQNDFCIKMGSDESHFNDWSIVRDRVTRQCPQTTTFLKGMESRSGTEPRPFCLPTPAGSNRFTSVTVGSASLFNIVRVQHDAVGQEEISLLDSYSHSSGAVWKSRWPSGAPRPNEPYEFCGRTATLNRA